MAVPYRCRHSVGGDGPRRHGRRVVQLPQPRGQCVDVALDVCARPSLRVRSWTSLLCDVLRSLELEFVLRDDAGLIVNALFSNGIIILLIVFNMLFFLNGA